MTKRKVRIQIDAPHYSCDSSFLVEGYFVRISPADNNRTTTASGFVPKDEPYIEAELAEGKDYTVRIVSRAESPHIRDSAPWSANVVCKGGELMVRGAAETARQRILPGPGRVDVALATDATEDETAPETVVVTTGGESPESGSDIPEEHDGSDRS